MIDIKALIDTGNIGFVEIPQEVEFSRLPAELLKNIIATTADGVYALVDCNEGTFVTTQVRAAFFAYIVSIHNYSNSQSKPLGVDDIKVFTASNKEFSELCNRFKLELRQNILRLLELSNELPLTSDTPNKDSLVTLDNDKDHPSQYTITQLRLLLEILEEMGNLFNIKSASGITHTRIEQCSDEDLLDMDRITLEIDGQSIVHFIVVINENLTRGDLKTEMNPPLFVHLLSNSPDKPYKIPLLRLRRLLENISAKYPVASAMCINSIGSIFTNISKISDDDLLDITTIIIADDPNPPTIFHISPVNDRELRIRKLPTQNENPPTIVQTSAGGFRIRKLPPSPNK